MKPATLIHKLAGLILLAVTKLAYLYLLMR